MFGPIVHSGLPPAWTTELCALTSTPPGPATTAAAKPNPPVATRIEPADHPLGRSRDGWGTKLHLACEHGLPPLSLLLTGGQAGDSSQFAAVLDGIRAPRLGHRRGRVRPDRVLADKAYSSAANRTHLRDRAITATIPIPADQAGHRRNRGRPPAFDPVIYQHRNTIEPSINRLKQHRTVATHYEKLATRYLVLQPHLVM